MSSGVVISSSCKFTHLFQSRFINMPYGTLGSLSYTVLGNVHFLPLKMDQK